MVSHTHVDRLSRLHGGDYSTPMIATSQEIAYNPIKMPSSNLAAAFVFEYAKEILMGSGSGAHRAKIKLLAE